MNPDVVFVDVPVTQANAALHQGLGVPSLPYGHIYHPQSGLVEEMKLTRKDIPEFREKLKSYTEGNCDVSPWDRSSYYAHEVHYGGRISSRESSFPFGATFYRSGSLNLY